jgi:hypothetical protein
MKRVITEATLRKIIYETVNIVLENIQNQMSFGTKGPIPAKPTSNLDSDFPKEVKERFNRVAMGDKSARIDSRLLGKPEYLGNTLMWTMFQQYSNAMNRRADLGRHNVNFGTFYKKLIKGWLGGPMSYYESNGNYLFGVERAGLFVCVYFAPKNAGMGMFKFIKEICDYDNVVFSVTLDLANMLERLGCPKWNDGEIIKVPHQGHLEDKKIYGSTQRAADEGAKLVKLMNNSKGINQNLTVLLSQNPNLQALYDKDPDIVNKFMANPAVLKYMMNHPDVIQKFLDDPTVAQQAIANPTAALSQYLQKKRPKAAQSTINEMRRRRK